MKKQSDVERKAEKHITAMCGEIGWLLTCTQCGNKCDPSMKALHRAVLAARKAKQGGVK